MMQASIYGRLGKDPETRTTSLDAQMVTTSVAVDVTPNNAENSEVMWLGVVAFGRVAEALARHSKGDLVSLSGRVTLGRWQARDGTERTSWQLVADSVISARTVRPPGRPKAKQPRRTEAAADPAPFNDP